MVTLVLGAEAEIDERAVAERDRPHRPRLEARRPGRAGGREGRVAARRAGHRVQADAAGTDGAEVRRHLDRLLAPGPSSVPVQAQCRRCRFAIFSSAQARKCSV